jgi:hypothetical protein
MYRRQGSQSPHDLSTQQSGGRFPSLLAHQLQDGDVEKYQQELQLQQILEQQES